MDKVDRRIQRTQQLLGDALVALILERGYDALTIKDITDRANVAHATFYRHYKDKEELLRQRLEAVVGEIQQLIEEPPLQDSEGYVIFKHAQENAALYRILLTSHGTTKVRVHVRHAIARYVCIQCEPLQHENSSIIPVRVAANHVAGSLLNLIEWWLENEMPYPAHQMAQIYQRLILDATMNTVAGLAVG
jgi:AcrR family transcriptional regulator